MTCRTAIQAVWPRSAVQDAYITLDHENGSESPIRVGHNNNGSTDNGCMQINSVHFGQYGWHNWNQIYDPKFNAQIALAIYHTRGWRAWYAVEGILWQ